MSKTRKTIVKFAYAVIYWYTHQANKDALKIVNRLEKRARRLAIENNEIPAFQQALYRPTYIEPSH